MRHPHDHAVYAGGAGAVNNGLKCRDEDFAAFQSKAFLRRPLPGQEVLKPMRSETVQAALNWSVNVKVDLEKGHYCYGTR